MSQTCPHPDLEEFLTHLNLPINKKLLLQEAKKDLSIYKPFDYHNMRSGQEVTSEPNSQWLWADRFKLDDALIYPELHKTSLILKEYLGIVNVRNRFIIQEANYSVPLHVDTLKTDQQFCNVNIVLCNEYAPIIFEEVGEVYYECALVNVMLMHSVPTFHKRRFIYKCGSFDKSYESAREYYLNKIS